MFISIVHLPSFTVHVFLNKRCLIQEDDKRLELAFFKPKSTKGTCCLSRNEICFPNDLIQYEITSLNNLNCSTSSHLFSFTTPLNIFWNERRICDDQWMILFFGPWANVLYSLPGAYVVTTPHPVTVTRRTIPFLVGDPFQPSFVTVTGSFVFTTIVGSCMITGSYVQSTPEELEAFGHYGEKVTVFGWGVDREYQYLLNMFSWSKKGILHIGPPLWMQRLDFKSFTLCLF